MLSKEAIFAANDVQIEKVEVPQWGGHVFIKTISAKAQDEWVAYNREQKQDGSNNETAAYIAMCVCDESGKLMFEIKEAEQLGEKSSGAMNTIFNKAAKLNRLDTKELAKNSETTQGDGSTTD